MSRGRGYTWQAHYRKNPDMTKTSPSVGFTAGDPPRQGFYKVETVAGRVLIAEWREHDKKVGKAWYEHLGETPTAEKVPTPLSGVQGYRSASKQEVHSALCRELTVHEKIQDTYKSYKHRAGAYPSQCTDSPPQNRRLSIGDAVRLGALEDCKVVGLFDEDQVVVVSHRGRKHSKETVDGIAYTATSWTEITKVCDESQESIAREPSMPEAYLASTVDSLLALCAKGLVDSPDYQRGYVWTDEDKQRYLDSWFKGRELGRFIFVRYDYPRGDEVLDGKQRLNCLWQFFTSQIAYQGRYWYELSQRDRNTLEGRRLQWAVLPATRYSRADLLRIFLEVNAAGVPQTEEHLAKVRAMLAEEEVQAKK